VVLGAVVVVAVAVAVVVGVVVGKSGYGCWSDSCGGYR
jgi:hypothetical protein